MKTGPYPNHLAKFMRASELTDPGLAKLVGITKQQIFNLRWGNRKLTVEWAHRLAPHLGVSWQELITGAPAPPPDQARIELLTAYEAMTEEQRRALLIVAKGMMPPAPQPSEPIAEGAPRRRSAACVIPVVRVRGR